MPHTLKVLPLGGLGEIGMNCLVLEYDQEVILIDCGIQFPDSSLPGVDILIPDFSYLSKFKKISGVVVTHGHDDHIGAIPFLAKHFELDVYSTPFPRGLLREKMQEHSGLKEIKFHTVEPRKSFTIGSFKFDPIPVQHSIIESVAFAIETPVGTLIHTGDFKHDPHEFKEGQTINFEPFKEWGKKGVKLLLSDSTNAERTGHTLSEIDIANTFEKIFREQQTRFIIALFASNIRRIENFLALAKRFNKKIAFAGRSMHFYTKLAHEQKTLDIPEGVLIPLDSVEDHPDKNVIILATGSQAEPQSALVRIANGEHKEMKLHPTDMVILSSRFIPGNERNITDMIDHLYRNGAEVMYESFHQIHVSGHGFQEELLMMLEAVKPEFFVPVHGEYRHLKKHSGLAKRTGVSENNIFVIENGQGIEIGEGRPQYLPALELKRVALVEGEVLEAAPEVFGHRLSLARTGIVFAVLVRDLSSFELLLEPIIRPYGILYRENQVAEDVIQKTSRAVEELYPNIKNKTDLLDLVRLEVRRQFKRCASHKPHVIPIVIEV